MKQKHFYSHLIDITVLDIPLSQLPISQKEKKHLLELSEENVHLTIIDVVLSQLPEEHKKEFLTHVHAQNHEKVWELLNTHISGVEQQISDTAQQVFQKLLEDIKTIHG